MAKKNPVQTTRRDSRKDVSQMTEEEMLEMALQNSIANGAGPKEDDPDAFTKSPGQGQDKGKAPVGVGVLENDPHVAHGANAAAPDTPFSRITSTHPHEEPTSADPTQTTRIQFRYSGGRIVRRFLVSDPVRRIYEWLKAAPFEGTEGQGFQLISMGKNLIDMLDMSIAEAGLNSGTVMVEFIDDE